jgi:predicted aconitase with swiveling domain
MTSGVLRKGHPLVAGEAAGTALVLEQPVSFAVGAGRASGRIKDIRSPQRGALVTSRILVMPIGRGSSSASAALAEAIRRGAAPRAIVLPGVDQILVIGAIVARTLYGRVCPILEVQAADYEAIASGDRVTIWKDGSFSVEPRRRPVRVQARHRPPITPRPGRERAP